MKIIFDLNLVLNNVPQLSFCSTLLILYSLKKVRSQNSGQRQQFFKITHPSIYTTPALHSFTTLISCYFPTTYHNPFTKHLYSTEKQFSISQNPSHINTIKFQISNARFPYSIKIYPGCLIGFKLLTIVISIIIAAEKLKIVIVIAGGKKFPIVVVVVTVDVVKSFERIAYFGLAVHTFAIVIGIPPVGVVVVPVGVVVVPILSTLTILSILIELIRILYVNRIVFREAVILFMATVKQLYRI